MNAEDFDFFPEFRVEMDVPIRDLLPGRVLRVTAVGIDESALRVRYEVTPPINPGGWEDAIKPEAVQYIWILTGHDNLGNQYEDWGGAVGLSSDSRRSLGERSLTPLPVSHASWLDLAFTSLSDDRLSVQPSHILRVNLPLDVGQRA